LKSTEFKFLLKYGKDGESKQTLEFFTQLIGLQPFYKNIGLI